MKALLLASVVGLAIAGSDRILLSSVKTLTFRKDKMTTGRRSAPMQQLQCVKGTGCGDANQPEVLQCENKGYVVLPFLLWSPGCT